MRYFYVVSYIVFGRLYLSYSALSVHVTRHVVSTNLVTNPSGPLEVRRVTFLQLAQVRLVQRLANDVEHQLVVFLYGYNGETRAVYRHARTHRRSLKRVLRKAKHERPEYTRHTRLPSAKSVDEFVSIPLSLSLSLALSFFT